VELVGKDAASVVGAKVTLEADGRRQTRFAKGGGSYASANDPRHVFGLGPTDRVGTLTVVWPSGQEQTWQGLAVDRYWRLTEGEREAK
jgi:enediyne biosynthesis protein E4